MVLVSDPRAVTLQVMAGVLRDAQGRVLLAQRPAGKPLAGCWEFPGGKLKTGESQQSALARELREELGVGIEPEDGVPLIGVPWDDGACHMRLEAWQFTRWRGTPAPMEGQALQWQLPCQVDLATLAPADRPILQALRLPAIYAITPADVPPDHAPAWQVRIAGAIERGARLIQLRFPLWTAEEVRELAQRLQPLVLDHAACLLLNGDIEGALRLGPGVGVHLRAEQLDAQNRRPLPWSQLIGASCHNMAQLASSVPLADFATLSPVAPTASHPHAPVLGWLRFRGLAQAAALPVYALGGMAPSLAEQARRRGAQGVAGIGAFW